VSAAVPQSERFVIAESFSTPLAAWYAATNPQNLVAVIICAGFVRSPVRRWSGTVKALARPWLFRLKPPRTIVEYFLLGQNAPPDLLQKLRRALHRVSPDVLSGRVLEVLDCDARDDLGRTTVPLLYLEATYDRLLSPSCKEEFSHLRQDILFKSIPAPHLLLQREPQKAATVMMAFISSLPPSRGPAIPNDCITMSAPRPEYPVVIRRPQAREKGAEHDDYRRRLPPEFSGDCIFN